MLTTTPTISRIFSQADVLGERVQTECLTAAHAQKERFGVWARSISHVDQADAQHKFEARAFFEGAIRRKACSDIPEPSYYRSLNKLVNKSKGAAAERGQEQVQQLHPSATQTPGM